MVRDFAHLRLSHVRLLSMFNHLHRPSVDDLLTCSKGFHQSLCKIGFANLRYHCKLGFFKRQRSYGSAKATAENRNSGAFSGARWARRTRGFASTRGIATAFAHPTRRLYSVHHRDHLDLDQLLRLAEFEHRHVGRRRLVIERREIRVDDAARPADVAHPRPRAENKIVNHVLE